MRALPQLFTPAAQRQHVEPNDAGDPTGVRRFQEAIGRREPSPDETGRAKAVLTRGGLSPEDAHRIVERGLIKETATDLLSVELLHPPPDQYGPAVAVVSILAEARELGALSGQTVQSRIAALASAVVLRPDGPEETLDGMAHALGRLPATIGRAIRTSPELLAAFESASPDDQTRFIASAVTQTYLLATALRRAPGATASPPTPPALGSIQLQADSLALTGANLELAADATALAQLGVRVTITASGIAMAESLDLHPSSDPRVGPTTIQDPKRRQRIRDRIERALGDPRDPNLPLEALLDHLELAPHLGEDAVRELKAMILERIEREVRGLDGLPVEMRPAKINQLRTFVDRAQIELRDALRNPAPAPPRTTLSVEAQRALSAIDGGRTDVQVASRAVAQEVLSQYRDYVDTGGWRMTEIKKLIGSDQSTFHWGEVFGEDGLLINHDKAHPDAKKAHLQLHRPKDAIVRIFFPEQK